MHFFVALTVFMFVFFIFYSSMKIMIFAKSRNNPKCITKYIMFWVFTEIVHAVILIKMLSFTNIDDVHYVFVIFLFAVFLTYELDEFLIKKLELSADDS
jgi:hypothetical protein